MARIDSRFIIWGTGARQVNSQVIPANFTPAVYVPTQVGTEGASQISSHLKGIDNFFDLRHDSQTTATSLNGTLTLVAANKDAQFLTGSSTGFSVVLPNATTLGVNRQFVLYNQSSQTVTVKDSTGATLFTLGQTSVGFVILQLNSTAAGAWINYQTFIGVANGIVNYQIISSTAFSTSSATDVAITGFTLTPTAGTYEVIYNAAILMTTSPVNHTWTVYKGGSAVTDSARTQITSRSNQQMCDATQTIVQVDGATAVDVRVNTAGGTLTVNQRSLILVRLGN